MFPIWFTAWVVVWRRAAAEDSLIKAEGGGRRMGVGGGRRPEAEGRPRPVGGGRRRRAAGLEAALGLASPSQSLQREAKSRWPGQATPRQEPPPPRSSSIGRHPPSPSPSPPCRSAPMATRPCSSCLTDLDRASPLQRPLKTVDFCASP